MFNYVKTYFTVALELIEIYKKEDKTIDFENFIFLLKKCIEIYEKTIPDGEKYLYFYKNFLALKEISFTIKNINIAHKLITYFTSGSIFFYRTFKSDSLKQSSQPILINNNNNKNNKKKNEDNILKPSKLCNICQQTQKVSNSKTPQKKIYAKHYLPLQFK